MSTTATDPRRLCTVAEAAELLGIPMPTVRSWVARRRVFPAGALTGRGGRGTTYLYRLADLEELATSWRSRRHTQQ